MKTDAKNSFMLAGEVFRKFFWEAYDNLGKLILVNLMWFTATMPLILLVVFRERVPGGWFLPLLFLSALVSALAAASVFNLTFLVMEGRQVSLPGDFFAGIKKFLRKGILLGAFSIVLFYAGLVSLRFYAGLRTSAALSVFLTGVGAWLVLMIAFMQNYLFPLMVQRNLKVAENLRHALYLIFDNPGFTFLIFLQVALLFLILGVSLIGIPVLFISLPALFYNEALRVLLIHKYGIRGEIPEKKRGWKEF